MNLHPTAEQHALRATAREFLNAAAPPAKVAEWIDSDASWEPALWRGLSDLGWLGVAVPEALGGTGLGLMEEAICFEEAGAALLPSPLFSSVALALPALTTTSGAEDLVEELTAGTTVATLAWADLGRDRALSAAGATTLRASSDQVSGVKVSVPDLDRADLFIVVAAAADGPALYAIRAGAPGVSLRVRRSVDPTSSTGDLALNRAPARLLARGPGARDILHAIWERALTLASAEAVGIMARVLEESVTYARDRKQFGRAIGSFQAVSHQLADSYVALELSRSAVLAAALSVDETEVDSTLAVATAAAKALPAAQRVCETAIQVHGGMGMTWETMLHRYFKRALSLSALDGPASRHRELVSEHLFGANGVLPPPLEASD